MDSTELTLSIVLPIVGVLLIAAVIIRYCWCCGPGTLYPDDIQALETFRSLYKHEEIEFEERIFETKSGRWLLARYWIHLEDPVENWGNMYSEECDGFLLEHAKFINGVLMRFQYNAWIEFGDMAENLPVMRIAQEFRNWAMVTLQKEKKPSAAAKALVRTRMNLIDSLRNLMFTNVADLRRIRGWSTRGEKASLLACLRDEVRPMLNNILEQWENFELQESIGERFRDLSYLLSQNARGSLRFLELVLRTKDIKLSSDLRPAADKDYDIDPKDYDEEYRHWAELVNRVEDLLQDTKQAWPEPEEVPPSALNVLSLTAGIEIEPIFEDGKDDEADEPKPLLRQDGETAPLLERDEVQDLTQYLKRRARLLAFIKMLEKTPPDTYGLDKSRFAILITEYTLFYRHIESIAACAAIIWRLARFAQLGGELLLSKALDKRHLVMVFQDVEKVLMNEQRHLDNLSDQAQRGWENMRADYKNNYWSSSGPIDNLRLALSSKVAISHSVIESQSVLRELTAKVEKLAQPGIREELNDEIKNYLEEFKAFQDILHQKPAWVSAI